MSDADPRPDRMLTVDDVATELKISARQAYALVRSGDLPAIRIGGRGQWRVEREALDEWIKNAYEATRRYIAEHPHRQPSQPTQPTPPTKSANLTRLTDWLDQPPGGTRPGPS